MLNRVQLIGRLGKDPEERSLPSGEMVVNFNLATDETYKDKSGEKVQNTEWHRIVVFGKLAEICAKYLVKGKLIYVEGKIQTRQWEDKEGNKRSTVQIVVRDMKMLPDGKSREGSDGGLSGNQGPYPDDDIPF